MDIPWIRVVSQCGVYATFALVLLWARRRGMRQWAPLVSGCGYAVLFEHWNMLRYAHVQGGYHYHASSWFWLWGDVPLYIPLAWAFILATSRSLTDALGLRPWARPFADALLALLIDVSMDAVAIRLKFWYWHGLSWNDGFFGVPADNFVGWLLVSFTFSALTRLLWSGSEDPTAAANAQGLRPGMTAVRSDMTAGASGVTRVPVSQDGRRPVHSRAAAVKIVTQIALIPPAAYVLYLGLESIVHRQYLLFHAETLQRQLYVLAGTIGVFGFVVVAGMRRRDCARTPLAEPDGRDPRGPHGAEVHGPRHVFHLFGLIGLFCVPAALRTPALWALAASVWAIEWTIALAAARSSRYTSERIR